MTLKLVTNGGNGVKGRGKDKPVMLMRDGGDAGCLALSVGS
jgi:hypothetical protein